MTEKIKNHLTAILAKENLEPTPENIEELIFEGGKEIYRESQGGSRHWNDIFIVADVEGMLIGYMDAETTGDMNAREKGWEFEIDSICEVEKITKTIEKYKPIR